MPEIRFFGGKLNNKKKFVNDLKAYYHNLYVVPNETQFELGSTPFVVSRAYKQVREVYNLIKIGYMVGDKYVIKVGYLKEGSKTKPETIWKKGLFYSESKCYTDYETSQGYTI